MVSARRLPADCRMKRSGALAISAAVWLVLAAVAAHAAPLTVQEQRGLQLYASGVSPSHVPLVAYFGRDLLEVPGESATCASCHGYDGLGRSESGIIPSNITWRQLTKGYGHIHAGGLEHPPFDEQNLKSYLQDGIYPGGKQGNPAMPVYRISRPDLDDLVAYLKRLGTVRDPGLTQTAIRVGVLLSSEDAAAGPGDVVRRTLVAALSDINAQGGIYGRRLELDAGTITNSAALPGFLRTELPEQGVFVLLNVFEPLLDAGQRRMLDELHIPQIAASPSPQIVTSPLQRHRFYLYPGLYEQALALAGYAARTQTMNNPRLQIIHPVQAGMDGLLESVEAVFRSRGWQAISRLAYQPGDGIPAGALQRIRREEPDLLLFLGGEHEAGELFREFGDEGCPTRLFLPGVPAGSSINRIPLSCKGRVWLAFPALPGDRREWGMNEFRAMAARQRLAVTNPAVQLAAHASVKVLAEGLRRSGRNLSRERLLESLEGLFEFDTGLTPLLTFTINRHTGAPGAYIVEPDPHKAGGDGFLVPRGWVPAYNPGR